MTNKAGRQKTKKLSVKRVTVKDLDVKGQKGADIRGGKVARFSGTLSGQSQTPTLSG